MPEDIDIEDIANALAMQCRFTGHTKEFYSVAQHSVIVSVHCRQNQLWGLLHDAPEAYLADVSRPVKRSTGMEPYKLAEKGIMRAVCLKYGLPEDEPAEVKEIDTMALVTEARDLMSPLTHGWRHPQENGYKAFEFKIVPLDWKHAKKIFLERFRELTR
jgi:hypothetical protein